MKTHTDLKTFEDACKIEGLNPLKVIPKFISYPKKDRVSMMAHAKLIIIVRAANRLANDNKEWKPDFNNYDQHKYEPWFEMTSSGCHYCDCWTANASVGSRLCFVSLESCEYIANQFIGIYNEYLI